ncbi:hypothetical protein KXQ82_14780 [Mucilaginibacter sp. HMF5004]|uniref:hypothetical protein n=1 Tax=Mucilaginibacter rivuli TaxID=2857527 RepID=UPI001C60044F|nr:hypothetical protein [Mucilaginibacter rivuli]MBW4890990.1 hypothetical protein [Mucilaginibacter rivuli]
MKQYHPLLLKTASLCFCLVYFSIVAKAQKLPDVQKVSMRVPAGVVIDGNAADWANRFQAYNTSASVWYNIANDDEKLYFVIHGEDADLIHKMMRGCVTITISKSGKKTDKDAAIITFPTYEVNAAPSVSLSGRPAGIADTTLLKLKTDTFMRRMNKRLTEKQKFIALNGIKQITDTLVSVYNDYEIEAKALLDNKLYYNYELAIPLKYLGLSVDKSSKFSYNIRLNGIAPKGATLQITGGGRVLVMRGDGSVSVAGAGARGILMAYPNDFWGEYTLAKAKK